MKKLIAFAILVCGLTACTEPETGKNTPSTNPPAQPTATSQTPDPNAPVAYLQGFYGEEKTADMSWRWMGEEGTVRLKNTGKEAVLKFKGAVQQDFFKEPPILTLKLNGEQLDQIKTTKGVMEKSYTIPAAKQKGDYSELSITSDKTFVPKEVEKGSSDPRKLSFSLRELTWLPK